MQLIMSYLAVVKIAASSGGAERKIVRENTKFTSQKRIAQDTAVASKNCVGVMVEISRVTDIIPYSNYGITGLHPLPSVLPSVKLPTH